MSRVLLFRELRSNWKLFAIFALVLSVYGGMIAAMFDPALGESLDAMAQSMPSLFAAFGMLNVGRTMLDFLANYLYGFLFVVFPLVSIILLSSRLVVRYVERGSMAYLLATPNTRKSLIVTQAIVLQLFVTLLVVYAVALLLACSAALFPGALDVGRFLLLNVGLLGLLTFFSGLCFCCSCVFNDSKWATGVGAGLSIFFVLCDMIANVGETFQALSYMTPLSLFDTDAIATGNGGLFPAVLILFAAGVALYALGMAVFSRKDMCV